jgi:replicative DNA helicase
MTLVPALDLRNGQDDDLPHAPANLEAEQALLGCILYDNSAYERLGDNLRPGHFWEPVHQRLFAAMETSIRKGQLSDPTLLMDQFGADPALGDLGGIRYLADLVDRAPPAANAADYARAIYDLALRRELIRISGQVGADAADHTNEVSARDQIEAAESALYELAETGQTDGGLVDFSEAVSKAVQMAAEAFSRDGGLSGLSTGLIDLDQKLGGLHPSDLVILAARPSMGKAQDLNAKVLRRDGTWTRMGELRLGDELASIDGAPSRVAGIFPQGERQVYRITLGDGRSTTACAEHLWAVKSSKIAGGSGVVTTARLAAMMKTVRFQRRVSLPLVSGHFGQDRDLPMDAWLLGALIGNGCMSGRQLAVSTADAQTLYRLQEVIGHQHLKRTGTGGYDYRISRGAEAGIAQALETLGLRGSGAAGKFIPPAYLAATRETRIELLRGLLDTDGWVETFGAARYCTVSDQLARDVQSLVRSLGGVCTIAEKHPRYTHKGEELDGQLAYTLNISHPDRGSLFSLVRKRRRCRDGARFRAPTIVSVEPEGVEHVQCIRVTHPSSLYVTDDYIVTHNTALAVNIAYQAARAYAYEVMPDGAHKTVNGGQVAFFSLEMSEEQLALRVLSEVSGVSGDRIRKGEIDASDFGRIRDASMEISSIPLKIDATGGITLGKLAARARRMKRRGGLDLIIIDYIQLMASGAKTDNRVQEITAITVGLKALAKELKVPILALSQLSRNVENREDKRPQLSDLRESGSIEQDADMVMFIYRESYYLGRTEPRPNTPEHLTWQEQMDQAAGQAEVIIGKQRHGPIGIVRLAFNEDLTKFGNLARDPSRYQPPGYRDPSGGG